nr:putative late blight resistance protein homolog R1B-16 [Ipomoea trifida]
MPQIINNILLLKNIRKLRFDFMISEWKAINVLSKLPRLEVLKIVDPNLGEKWELTENVKFCHLICLKIQSHDLMHWEVGANNFPKLERLFLNSCSKLRKIPNSFAEIPALSLIQLKRCLPSTVMSAKQIQAEQHDYGNENMIVIEKDTEKFSILFLRSHLISVNPESIFIQDLSFTPADNPRCRVCPIAASDESYARTVKLIAPGSATTGPSSSTDASAANMCSVWHAVS